MSWLIFAARHWSNTCKTDTYFVFLGFKTLKITDLFEEVLFCMVTISCFSGLNRGSIHVTWRFKVKPTTFDALRALSVPFSHMEMNSERVLCAFLQHLRNCARLQNATAAAIGYCTLWQSCASLSWGEESACLHFVYAKTWILPPLSWHQWSSSRHGVRFLNIWL